MTRDICHAAKHGDLMWNAADAAVHGPVLAKLEYRTAGGTDQSGHYIFAVRDNGTKHDVVDVLRRATADWSLFIDEQGI